MTFSVPALIAAFVIMAASLAGVAFSHKGLSHLLSRNLKVLIAFAGGVFAVLTYSLFAEALEHGASFFVIVSAALGGMLFIEIADRLIPHAHHHHDTVHDHAHRPLDAHRMLWGDAVHNIADGIILVPAFMADIRIGIGAAAAIFLHELVQEIAEFFVLKEAGYSTKGALTRNFAASSTIILGVVLAASLSSVEAIEAPLLAFAAGAFAYVIVRDLAPSIARSVREGIPALRFVVAAVIGAVLLFSVQTLIPHEYEEEHTVDEAGTISE